MAKRRNGITKSIEEIEQIDTGSKRLKNEDPALLYLGDFPMAPSRMIVRFKCASSHYFSLAEDPLEERRMMEAPFSARKFRQKVPSNMKSKKKEPYPCHYGSPNRFKHENTRRRGRRGDASAGVDILWTELINMAVNMKELEAWRFAFHGENESKKIDRTRSVSPFSPGLGTFRSPTIEDQSQSDFTEKESPHQCRDTLLSKNCLMRLQNGFLYHKDITIITNATKRQMEYNQTPDVLCIVKFHSPDYCLVEYAILDMIVNSPTEHRVEVMLSESPQRLSNVRYFHWEDEAAVDRCIEEYHSIFTRPIHSRFLILSRAPNNRQVWEVKK